MTRKVFGIGLNKTGTSTLGECLVALGYRHRSYSYALVQQLQRGEQQAVLSSYRSWDSFEDWPTPWLWRELDQYYPGSLFILTRRRSVETWLKSIRDHALRTSWREGAFVRNTFYGSPYPQLAAERYRQVYVQHIAQVRSHFSDRPQQLLELCWEEGESWDRLCAFLDREPPQRPLPHANAGAGQRALKQRLLNGLAWRWIAQRERVDSKRGH